MGSLLISLNIYGSCCSSFRCECAQNIIKGWIPRWVEIFSGRNEIPFLCQTPKLEHDLDHCRGPAGLYVWTVKKILSNSVSLLFHGAIIWRAIC